MGAEKGSSSLNQQGQVKAPAAVHRYLGECRSRTLEYASRLPALLRKTLEKELAERDASVPGQAEARQLGEGLSIILKNGANLGERFSARIQHHFEERLQPASAARQEMDAGGTGLTLVNDSELEESLAVTTTIGKLQERYSEELFGLGQRLGELSSGEPIDNNRLPMGPDSFCHAFRDALAALTLEPGVRIQSYKLFERVLLQSLGDLYTDLNNLLIEKGVLPQLKVKIRTQPSAPQHAGVAAGRSAAGPSGGTGGGRSGAARKPVLDDNYLGEMVAPIQDQMYQAIQYLLGTHGTPPADASPGTGGAAGGIHLPATPMLIDTLSTLQHDPALVERSGELLRGGLKQHVVGRFETMDNLGRPGVINQIDDETIDVISMIFDYILDDKTLPDFIKAMIGRLQIPVLKVAIVDRGFFTDKLHPARQLLNELAYAGVGWTEESEAAKDRLYEKMEATVRRILGEFDNDVGIFANLLDDFRGFLDEEKRNFAFAQEQIGIQAQESGQLERVRLRAAEEIAARLAGRTVPEEIREFLATSWLQLVTTVHLEDGEDGPACARALQVMDDLLWSIEPKTNAEQRRRLGVLLPILLAELREAQLRIGRSEDDIKTFAAVLEQHHFTSLKAGRLRNDGKAAPVQESPAAAAPDKGRLGEIDRMFRELSGDIDKLPEIDVQGLSGFDDLIDRKDPDRQSGFDKMMADMGFQADGDAGPRVEDRHTVLVRSLELGTWIELTEPGGGKLRVKLAWVGDAYTNFSFVNRQYKVVAERPMYVLAEEFRTGAARVIEDVALFDRALDGVISGIMKFTRPRHRADHV